jgi:hypothetical protein
MEGILVEEDDMRREEKTWLSFMAAFAASLVVLGLAIWRVRRQRR